LSRALARAAASGTGEGQHAADMIRRSIREAQEHSDRQMAVNMFDAVAVLIGSDDPPHAYLLSRVFKRVLPGAIGPELITFDGLDPDRRAELDAEAAAIDLDDALMLAIAVVDRYYPPT
jgi:hypothetical protein